MSRRLIDKITAALLLIGLGYVVAVSARSLPGQGGDDAPLAVDIPTPDWMGQVFNLLVLIAAAFTAVFLLLSVAKAAPRQLPRVRRWLGLLVWIVVFVLVYSLARPAAEEAVSGTLPPLEDGETAVDTGTATAAGWVVSVLLAAVIAAALTRIGFLVKSIGSPLDIEEVEEDRPQSVPGLAIAEPIERVAGDDPSVRVINAYADFETEAGGIGIGRRTSETAWSYSTRAGNELDLQGEDLLQLAGLYSVARFADHEISQADAQRAESAWERIKARLPR